MKFLIQKFRVDHLDTDCWLANTLVDDLRPPETQNKFIDKNGQQTRNYIEYQTISSKKQLFNIPEIFNTKRYLIQTIKKYYSNVKIVQLTN